MTVTAHRQRLWGARQRVDPADPYSLNMPVNDLETIGAKRITFMLFLDSIVGGPTAAKLTIKYQKAHASPGDVEFVSPVWQDFTDHDVTHRCLGGLGWGYQDVAAGLYYPRPMDHMPGVVHDSAISGSLVLGYAVTGTVIEPYDKVRIQLAATFPDGVAPAYLIAPYWEVK